MRYLVILLLVFLSACKDSRTESPARSPQDVVRSAPNALTEMQTEDALRAHGFPQMLDWAKQGYSKAQYMVAFAYVNGAPGVPRNDELGYLWLRRSANQGSAAGLLAMGMWYRAKLSNEDLLAMDENMVLMYMWTSLAEAAGHPQARPMLDEFLSRMGNKMPQDVIRRGQKLAAAWSPCKSTTCMDFEPEVPPQDSCIAKSDNISCIRTNRPR